MNKYYEEWGTPKFGEIQAQLEMAIEEEKQENKSDIIDIVIETVPKIPVLQNNSIEEKSCNNCKHNGNQMIYPSACTGCFAYEEYNNHEYSR